jgi:hypothetical protein
MPLPFRSRLLQLVPPWHTVSRETRTLAEEALSAACSDEVALDARRRPVRRGLWDAARALHTAHDGAQLIHAVGAAVWACLGARTPVLYTPDITPTPSELGALTLVGRTAPLIGIAGSSLAPLRRSSVRWTSLHRIEPAASDPHSLYSRDDIRTLLGLEPHDHVVLALGDTTRNSGHELLLWVVAILSMTDPRWKLLVPGSGRSLPRLRRFGAHLTTGGTRADPLIIASDAVAPGLDSPEALPLSSAELLRCCDLAMFAATKGASTLELREAILAEVPILATPSPAAAELLPPALLLPDRKPRPIAQRLLELHDPHSAALQANLEVVTRAALRLRERSNTPASTASTTTWPQLLGSLAGQSGMSRAV